MTLIHFLKLKIRLAILLFCGILDVNRGILLLDGIIFTICNMDEYS